MLMITIGAAHSHTLRRAVWRERKFRDLIGYHTATNLSILTSTTTVDEQNIADNNTLIKTLQPIVVSALTSIPIVP